MESLGFQPAMMVVMPIFLLMLAALGAVTWKSLTSRQEKIEEDQRDLFTLKVVFAEVRLRVDERLEKLEKYNEEFTRLELESLRRKNDEKDKEIIGLNAKALLLAAKELAEKKTG